MADSLLAHIASNFTSQYENVANSSICYILNEYPVSRQALKNVLGGDVATPVRYTTEEAMGPNGRPDVTGKDAAGNTVVIIEGKFWANLTDNQPNGYLRILAPADGWLLFLAPDKRKKSLELELEKRMDGKNDSVFVHSWHDFLKAIEIENNKNHDSSLSSDLNQLKSLCQRMDVEGMPPLSSFDLDPMNGRVSAHLADIIDECNSVLRHWEHADFSGLKTTSQKYGHGFYFRGYKFGCYLCVANDHWFMRDNHTPIWLSVLDYDSKKYQSIEHILNGFDPENTCEYKLGIILKPGMDKSQVVHHIVDRIKATLGHLNEVFSDE